MKRRVWFTKPIYSVAPRFHLLSRVSVCIYKFTALNYSFRAAYYTVFCYYANLSKRQNHAKIKVGECLKNVCLDKNSKKSFYAILIFLKGRSTFTALFLRFPVVNLKTLYRNSEQLLLISFSVIAPLHCLSRTSTSDHLMILSSVWNMCITLSSTRQKHMYMLNCS